MFIPFRAAIAVVFTSPSSVNSTGGYSYFPPLGERLSILKIGTYVITQFKLSYLTKI